MQGQSDDPRHEETILAELQTYTFDGCLLLLVSVKSLVGVDSWLWRQQ